MEETEDRRFATIRRGGLQQACVQATDGRKNEPHVIAHGSFFDRPSPAPPLRGAASNRSAIFAISALIVVTSLRVLSSSVVDRRGTFPA